MSYNKRTWANGDLITKERMNNIEDGIYDAHDEINAINNIVEENITNTNTAKQDISDIKLQIGTEELTTTSKKIKGAINELSSQIKDKADNIDVEIQNSRIDNIIAVQESTDNIETTDIRIDKNNITHYSAGASVRFNQHDYAFDYNETPLSEGYKKYEFFPFEKGSVSPTNGNDVKDTVSIRTKNDSLIKFDCDMIILNKNNSLYRWRLYKYDNDGNYIGSSTTWNTNEKTIVKLEDLKYRMQIATLDGSEIILTDAIKSINVINPNEKIKNLEELESYIEDRTSGSGIKHSEVASTYGFNCFANFDFEIGGITVSNGNNDNSVNCCRTDFIKGVDLKVKNVPNSNFRYRFVVYNNAKDTVVSNTPWNYNTDYNFSCNPDQYVRIVCATKTAPNMDMKECFESIRIFKAEDELFNNSSKQYYWKAYLKTKADRIRMLLQDGTNKIVFGVTTDTHYNPTADFNRNMTADIIDYINKECNIDTFIHLGDLISENMYKNTALSFHNYVTKEFKRVAPIYLPIKGNHDDNHKYTFGSAITNSDMYSTTFRTLTNVVFGGDGTYYYHDKPFEKVRFIMLNSSDFVFKKSESSDKLAEVQLAWGYEQLKWLVEKALDVPDEYKIIICSHAGIADTQVTKDYPSTSPQTKPRQSALMREIIKHYNEKQDLSTTTSLPDAYTPEYYSGSIVGQFSKAKGEIIGFLSGHEHIDDVQIIDNTNVKNIFFLNNSGNFADSVLNSKYQPNRSIGTISEETYDIVIVDKKNRIYHTVRIGAGDDERIINF